MLDVASFLADRCFRDVYLAHVLSKTATAAADAAAGRADTATQKLLSTSNLTSEKALATTKAHKKSTEAWDAATADPNNTTLADAAREEAEAQDYWKRWEAGGKKVTRDLWEDRGEHEYYDHFRKDICEITPLIRALRAPPRIFFISPSPPHCSRCAHTPAPRACSDVAEAHTRQCAR